MTLDEWRQLRDRVKALDQDSEPAVLAPAEAFSDERGSAQLRTRCGLKTDPESTGPRSATVDRRIASSCAGWLQPPTPKEFFDAIRAAVPTPRQKDIIGMWVFEATDHEIMQAWAEEAYSFRELARAIHNAGAENDWPERNQELNGLTNP